MATDTSVPSTIFREGVDAFFVILSYSQHDAKKTSVLANVYADVTSLRMGEIISVPKHLKLVILKKQRLFNLSKEQFERITNKIKWYLREYLGFIACHVVVRGHDSSHEAIDKAMKDSLEIFSTFASHAGATMSMERLSRENPGLFISEVFIHTNKGGDGRSAGCCVAALGDTCAGKSTLISVLTRGHLDNGRGDARNAMFRHEHEMRSGQTSSVKQDILGFDSEGQVINYKRNVPQLVDGKQSSKLVTFVDLPGRSKYLRTVSHGLTSYSPHYIMLTVSGDIGLSGMTCNYLNLAMALSAPIFVVITKRDVAKQHTLNTTIQDFTALLNYRECKRVPLFIESENDAMHAAMSLDSVVPIFVVSSVTGHHLNLLCKFLHLLPPAQKKEEVEKAEQEPVLLEIQETFSSPIFRDVICCGTLTQGIIKICQNLLIGPFDDGSFHPVQVKSIHRHRDPCITAHARETGIGIALNGKLPKIQRGMILCAPALEPQATRSFMAKIVTLPNPKIIREGFTTVVHVGSVQQTAVLEQVIQQDGAVTKEVASVHFRFLKRPEFVRSGSPVLFRVTGNRYATGNVTEVFPIEQQYNLS